MIVCLTRLTEQFLTKPLEVFTNGAVRPEPVEGQSRTVLGEGITRHEVCGYMLRRAQHERFPGSLPLINHQDLRVILGSTSLRQLPMTLLKFLTRPARTRIVAAGACE